MEKILFIIPARGGSKGIPRKNLRSLNGKPLIFYSIKNCLQIKSYDCDCYVTSDDQEILTLSKKFGAKTILRGISISGDLVTLDPVIYDAYTKASKIERKQYDLVVTVQPTSPLLSAKSMERAIQRLIKSNLDTIISGVSDSHLTWLQENGKYTPNYKERVNRQFLPKIFKETGGFVITKAENVLPNSRFGNQIELFPLNKKEAIDIDDYDDWSLCEYYLARKTILFVVTGYSEIGLGHVYNALSIANEIMSHRLIFLVDKKSRLALEKISESNYEVHIQTEKNILMDIEKFCPDIVISDILDTDKEYVKGLNSKGFKSINFEDVGEGSQYADLVINAMYPDHQPKLNHFYGHNYFILRDEFLYTENKIITPDVKSIGLTFGGVDPNNYTQRILHIIYEYCLSNNIRIDVILGMGYRYEEDLYNLFPKANFHKNVTNISELIFNSDMVFTSAGRTTFEVASIGVPSIVLCQNQRECTHFFAIESNGFYNLGLGTEVSDQNIHETFLSVLKDFELRKAMSHRMLRNHLKNGKKNVLKLIKELIQENQYEDS